MRTSLHTASLAVLALLGTLNSSEVLADQKTFFSEAGSTSVTHVADNGDHIGMDERHSYYEGDPNKYIGREQVYYFRKANEDSYSAMPKLDGFTAAFAYDLSNTGRVAGASTRPVANGSSRGASQAVVWTPAHEELTALPNLEGSNSSRATSISADGTRIVGCAIVPNGYTPVLWEERDGSWSVTALATVHPDNPFMAGAGSIVISDDGNNIYAPLTYEKIFEPGMVLPLYRSATYGYAQEDGGAWTRRKVFEHGLTLAEASNRGHLTGSITTQDGTRAYCFSPETGLSILGNPGEGGNATACGVNDDGVVVGYYDNGAHDGGPVAVRWSNGSAETLTLEGARYSIAFDINNTGTIVGLIEPPFDDPKDDHTDGFVFN